MRNYIRNLTPQDAFELVNETNEEHFISNFICEGVECVDEMARIYASELPISQRTIFSLTEMEHIEKLISKHLQDYVEKQGGISNMDLYTCQECDDMMNNIFEDIKNIVLKGGDIY